MSATPAVDALLDEKAIEHLDFAPTCEAVVYRRHAFVIGGLVVTVPLGRSKRCALGAVGVVTCRACGSATTVCVDHRALVASWRQGECLDCGTVGAGALLFRFTPWPGA